MTRKDRYIKKVFKPPSKERETKIKSRAQLRENQRLKGANQHDNTQGKRGIQGSL